MQRIFKNPGGTMRKMSILLVVLCFVFCGENPVDADPIVCPADPVTDIDGNVYQTVRIGNQVWMAENLRVTKYNDGTAIPHLKESSQWTADSAPGYCYYNNATHPDTIKKWGALYNWYAVSPNNPKQISPAGWRVPSDADWTVLENYLIAAGYNFDGISTGNKIAKSLAAKTDWESSTFAGAIGNDLSKNNATGFSALPGGNRSGGGFIELNKFSYWWTATEVRTIYAYYRHLYFNNDHLDRFNYFKSGGYSVRLVRAAE